MNEKGRRRRRLLAVSGPAAAAVLAGAVVAVGAGTGAAAEPASAARTATAETRELSLTATADGVVESAAGEAVLVGRTAAVPVGDGTASGTDGNGAPARPASMVSSAARYVPVGYVTSPSASASPSQSASPSPTASPSASPTALPSGSPTGSPHPTAAPSPTGSPHPTAPPSPTKVPTRQPPGGGAVTQPGGGGSPAGGRNAAGATGAGAGGGAGFAGGAGAQQSAAESAKTLTAIAPVGATVKSGSVVYALDGEPVVAVVGNTPSWRTLKTGVDDGPDVRTLEKNLRDLGYDDGLTLDDHFSSATAAAVEEWETDLGRADPDGVVDSAEILLIGAPGQVVSHDATVGDAVPDDTQVLALESNARVVTATIAAEDAAAWKPGAPVTIRWSGGGTAAGKVTAVGRDADPESGTVDVAVVPTKGGIRQHTGTTADVDLVTGTRAGVVAVPVAALHAGPAVTVVTADGSTTERPVTIGLVADGWAEMTAGVAPGEKVRLP